MKQSMRATTRQLTLWSARENQVPPIEEIHQEVTRVLADLLLEALAAETKLGGVDESQDQA